MITVVILGAGNVAQHLYAAFYIQKSIKVVQCFNRQGVKLHENQTEDTITTDLKKLADADIYILAISDDAIESVSNALPFKNRLVVHTSGSAPMQAINNANNRGVFYPLQTFSAGKEVNFSKVPFCIEADLEKDVVLLKKLAATLSQKIYDISSEQRSVLHVAAVFVNNFSNYMFSIGNEICIENNVPFEILHPLIQETAKKIVEIEPDKAQTGPAIRKDTQTIERHLSILKGNSQKELYKMLTEAIQSKYGKEL
ncbi:Rossmann-like and DUF2520 domain-containing protein [Aquimarina sp. 2201CG14-23]|uniref:Rossmann-like and DUF2520 domain-containing protein n=1 Tax=Aquimarina mycalae TaxID=3040073 RepID=UPI002477E30E|nr:DUF2520 domain-containing protein [Aquimarina sp. 2201CG14-23]MDH7446770.1 DUF2520 domain-containing protein [Aquimarina sp. 2201CG14-23]